MIPRGLFVGVVYIALQDIKTKQKTDKIFVHLACDAPYDKSKHLLSIHVIYENYGISAGKVWVSPINQ